RRDGKDQGRGNPGHRPALRRHAGVVATLHRVGEGVFRGRLRRRDRVRRIEHPRISADPGKRHAAVPGSVDRLCRPVRSRDHALSHLQRQGPDHRRVLLAGSRNIAQKAEAYLKSTGIGDTAYFGPEPEFFIFDDIRFGQTYNEGYYHIDASEGFWNAGRVENPDAAGNSRNLGYKPRYKEGYFPDLRTEMLLTLEQIGVEIEVHHHEVGTAGQGRDRHALRLAREHGRQAAEVQVRVKNVARRHGKTVTLMPKPLFQDNGSGMHVHQSLWKDGRNQFFEAGNYGDLSQMALHYIGGVLKHAPALLALTNPTTNSYRRLVPGYEAPINLIYSMRNRSAAVRIPVYSNSEKAKRIETRFPDPTCNGYLAFSALLMAGLDGIQNKITPPGPLDKDLYDLPPEEMSKIDSTPADLSEALNALEADHEFLLKGDVFTPDVIETWIAYKRENEIDAIRLRAQPPWSSARSTSTSGPATS
ncbi:Glutamine synthetase, partial [Geodia barretti]